MKSKKIMLILITAIFLASIAGVCAADANDTLVASENTNQIEISDSDKTIEDNLQTSEENPTLAVDENDETLSYEINSEILTADQFTYSNLREQIGSGGNINLTKGTYTYNGDGDTIEITTSGVINGNGAVIDMANSGHRAFYVTASGVTIKNLTIKNANYNGDGGAIYFSSSGTVTNCNFTNNTADSDGGAVYFDEDGTVTNCNFTNNQATGTNSRGGAIIFVGTGNVTNCNFTNNTATGNGGAVFFLNNGYVTNCNFTDNKVTGDESRGGAVYFSSSGNVTNCNFTNNSASIRGGAIYFSSSGSTHTVESCNFTNNKVSGFRCWGGAIYMYSGTVTNCNFVNNTATRGSGGAVYFDEQGTVTNCNFTNNSASLGGAVYFYQFSTCSVTNCNFTNNKGTGDGSCGGAIYFYVNGNVTNCNFTNNKADYGGAIRFNREGTVTNCNFTNNNATDGGGAIYFSSSGSTHTVESCNFTNNKALGFSRCGGAIYFYGNGDVTNCNFVNNTATRGSGGAVYFNIKGDVTNCNFVENSANSGVHIYSLNSYTNADTCIFKTDPDSNVNVVNFPPTLNVDNFTTFYGFGEKLTFNLTTDSGIPVYNGNISISLYYKNNDSWFGNYSRLSGEGWTVDLPVGSYYAVFDTEYAGFNAISRTIKVIPDIPFYANVTPVTTNNKTVNITAKSNILQDIVEGKLLFILPNGDEINGNYSADGIWWAEHTFDDYAVYQVNASYIGLSNVTINNATVSISKANSTVELSDVVLGYGETKNVTVTTEGATGITAKINDANVTVVNNFTIPISGLAAGNYTLAVTTIADDDHNPVTKTVKITVNKAHTEILIVNETLDLKVGDETIVATLTPADAGNVTFTSSNVSVVSVDSQGNVIAQGKGQAIIALSFVGNNNYAPAENKTITVTVSLNDASVTVDKDALDLKIYETYAINATKHPDTILLDITYTSSNSSVATVDEKGIVTAVGVGSAVITVEVGDDEIYAKNSTTVKVTVSKVPTEIAADPIAATYNANKDLVITLKDSNGNPIGGLNITVDLNGTKNYTTDTSGQVRISTKGLAANIYDVLISFNGTDKYLNCSNTTTVSIYKESSRVDTKPLTTDYNVHKYLVVGLKDNEGNPIRNADAYIEIHGVTYKCRSDDKGNARLIIRLNPGTYTAKITFDNVNYTGFTQYVTVIVKKLTPKMTAKKKTFKKSKKVKKYTVTLKANSKALAKVKLTLKVKGKTYKAKTNAKGKAVFKIKKLTKKGKYKATVKFAGNTYYNKVTKKVKITIK